MRCTTPGCAYCPADSPGFCPGSCAFGYRWAGDADGCQPCPTGCYFCDEAGPSGACNLCAPGFYKQANLSCAACPPGDAVARPAGCI